VAAAFAGHIHLRFHKAFGKAAEDADEQVKDAGDSREVASVRSRALSFGEAGNGRAAVRSRSFPFVSIPVVIVVEFILLLLFSMVLVSRSIMFSAERSSCSARRRRVRRSEMGTSVLLTSFSA